MPENLYFRQPDTQRALTDILFVFCKLNPDVSYRQGMHELLAPILWAVERDAIDLGQSSKAMGEDAVIKSMFDSEHIEHDAFALFGQVMQSAKVFYEQTTSNGNENPMVARSRRIFGELLSLVDERLAKHLERIDIVPQVFLIRWIRLLFGREFSFDDVLTMWDVIFAEDPSLEVVDYICVAMLLRIRWDLIEADYNVALTLLLRYPEPGAQLPAQTLALDGLFLREHMDYHSGSYLVSKYSGRPLQQAGRPVTPPALQRNITTMAVTTAAKASAISPSRSPRPTQNLENVLQSTARNIYARGEKLGINKVVRSAVDEVQRKAQEIRDTQTPTPSPPWRPRDSSRTSLGIGHLLGRVQALEDRSKQLAKLLEGAVSELWEYQRMTSESSRSDEQAQTTNLDQLSVAIAKVQFIQVYLDDPGMPLPRESVRVHGTALSADPGAPRGIDTVNVPESTDAGNVVAAPAAANDDSKSHAVRRPKTSSIQELTDPEVFADLPDAAPSKEVPDVITVPAEGEVLAENNTSEPPNAAQAHPTSPSAARPRLEQSSLSWMLEKQDGSSRQTFASASAFLPENATARGSLFGHSRGDGTAAVKNSRPGSSENKQKVRQSSDATAEQEDNVFDMGSLRHSKGRKA